MGQKRSTGPPTSSSGREQGAGIQNGGGKTDEGMRGMLGISPRPGRALSQRAVIEGGTALRGRRSPRGVPPSLHGPRATARECMRRDVAHPLIPSSPHPFLSSGCLPRDRRYTLSKLATSAFRRRCAVRAICRLPGCPRRVYLPRSQRRGQPSALFGITHQREEANGPALRRRTGDAPRHDQ